MATTHRRLTGRRLKRSSTIVMAASMMMVTMLSSTGPAAAESRDFLGRWTSIDSDGSHQTLWIRGTAAHDPRNVAITYQDDFASQACDGDPAKVTGTGRFDGDVLVMRGALTCTPGGNWIHGRIDLGYTYDSGNDTLVDFDGIVWERA